MSENQNISLSELNKLVANVLKKQFAQTFRVVAEISQIQENHTGHAYLELIEKETFGDNLTAKARATIWASVNRMLKPYFRSVTGTYLEAGMKVLLVVSIEFHEVYGYSLNIKDIDPTYTLGDMERRRLEIIRRLEEEGVMDMNKTLELTEIPQRIAIISSQTAAGYEDFMRQISDNPAGYIFYTKLFTAVMQGRETSESVVAALDKIAGMEEQFDAVVILRGGGSKTDLQAFDDYWIALNISQFPLPVLTGIGHERDESVADLVAHTSLKTPTAVAEFLIERLSDFDSLLSDISEQISRTTKDLLFKAKSDLAKLAYQFVPIVKNKIHTEHRILDNTTHRLETKLRTRFDTEHNRIKEIFYRLNKRSINNQQKEYQRLNSLFSELRTQAERNILRVAHRIELARLSAELLSPEQTLKRGFAYITQNNSLVSRTSQLDKDTEITATLIDGTFTAEVKSISKSKLNME